MLFKLLWLTPPGARHEGRCLASGAFKLAGMGAPGIFKLARVGPTWTHKMARGWSSLASKLGWRGASPGPFELRQQRPPLAATREGHGAPAAHTGRSLWSFKLGGRAGRLAIRGVLEVPLLPVEVLAFFKLGRRCSSWAAEEGGRRASSIPVRRGPVLTRE